MALLAVVIILIVWAVIGIKEKSKPTMPPINDINEHCKSVMQLPDKKSRQKYINKLARKEQDDNKTIR